MEKLTEKKRHHYVPRFLLRNFSPDGRRISLVVCSTGKRVLQSSIARQCYEENLYGHDDVMEDALGKEEAAVASILGDMNAERLESLPLEALTKLTLFTHFQRARTVGSVENLRSMVGAIENSVANPLAKNAEHAKSEHREVPLQFAQSELLWNACTSIPLLLDLDIKFIMTNRSPGFIMSDNPVVFYNQYAEQHADLQHCLGITGLAARGLQIFLPLSPDVTLTLFDPSVYQLGSQHRRTCRAGPADVTFLNQMQAVQGLECLYFSAERNSDDSLDELLRRRQGHPLVYRHGTMASKVLPNRDGQFGQLVLINGEDIRIGAKLSFVRILDQRRMVGYNRANPPERSQGRIDRTRQFRNILDGLVEEQRKATEKMTPEELVVTACNMLDGSTA